MNKELSEKVVARDDKVMSDVMKLRFAPLVAKKAKGAYFTDVDGNEFLDFSASWGVMNAGYSHPRIVEAVKKQMEELQFISTISVFNEESVGLAERLVEMMPGDFEKKVWLGHCGSDANEFLAKMVPLATGRSRIVSFVGSYHGQTMGAYGMSGHPALDAFTAGANVTKLYYPNCYRCPFEMKEDSCDLYCMRHLEDYVFQSVVTPESVGAVVVEPIQCDGGDIVPAKGFMKRLQEFCNKHGILFIVDEVKIGFARTGRMFGFQLDDLTPDAVVMGKGMGCGQPLSAVVGRKDLMDSGLGLHLFTTAGNPLACVSCNEFLNIVEEEGLCDRAKEMGDYFLGQMEQLKAKHEIIGDVRGRGLIDGVELIEDLGTKAPATDLASLAVYRGYELGLIFYNAGIYSNVLEFTPPLIIGKEEVDKAVDILDRVLGDIVKGNVDKEGAARFAGWSVQ